jgi:hypothetical protein
MAHIPSHGWSYLHQCVFISNGYPLSLGQRFGERYNSTGYSFGCTGVSFRVTDSSRRQFAASSGGSYRANGGKGFANYHPG